MAKRVSLPNRVYLALSKLAAKRDRSVDRLVEEIAGEWIRHTRALERRVGKSVFHVGTGQTIPSSDGPEPLLRMEQGPGSATGAGLCEPVELDDQEPTVH